MFPISLKYRIRVCIVLSEYHWGPLLVALSAALLQTCLSWHWVMLFTCIHIVLNGAPFIRGGASNMASEWSKIWVFQRYWSWQLVFVSHHSRMASVYSESQKLIGQSAGCQVKYPSSLVVAFKSDPYLTLFVQDTGAWPKSHELRF